MLNLPKSKHQYTCGVTFNSRIMNSLTHATKILLIGDNKHINPVHEAFQVSTVNFLTMIIVIKS